MGSTSVKRSEVKPEEVKVQEAEEVRPGGRG